MASAPDSTADYIRDPEKQTRDAIAIARKGQERASNIDGLGYLLIVVGLVGAGGAVVTAAASDRELTDGELVGLVAGSVGVMVVTIVAAVLLLGFGAMVRTTSQTLLLAALERAPSAPPRSLPDPQPAT
jgi:hypothetical protein